MFVRPLNAIHVVRSLPPRTVVASGGGGGDADNDGGDDETDRSRKTVTRSREYDIIRVRWRRGDGDGVGNTEDGKTRRRTDGRGRVGKEGLAEPMGSVGTFHTCGGDGAYAVDRDVALSRASFSRDVRAPPAYKHDEIITTTIVTILRARAVRRRALCPPPTIPLPPPQPHPSSKPIHA